MFKIIINSLKALVHDMFIHPNWKALGIKVNLPLVSIALLLNFSSGTQKSFQMLLALDVF